MACFLVVLLLLGCCAPRIEELGQELSEGLPGDDGSSTPANELRSEEFGEKSGRPVFPGETAPDWDVIAWSDGQHRSLEQFAEKVVVIDFWGKWCAPCLQLIPVLKKLEKLFAPRGVVFLTIHTAGSEMKDVKEILREKEWAIPTAIDRGSEIVDGSTTRRFGVIGYPTLIIVGHDGLIAYNSSADMLPARKVDTLREYEEITRKLGFTWPIGIDEGRDFREMKRQLRLLAETLYWRKINAALEAQEDQKTRRR